MAKPRYRKNVIVRRSIQQQNTSARVEGHDQNSESEMYVTETPADGTVSLDTAQQDYYPWDAGAHIITEDIEDFQINTSFDYLTTDADKTHRDMAGNIISQTNSAEIGQDFVVVPQRYVLEKNQYVDILDVSITELIPEVEYGPTGPPILRENPTSGETTGIIIFPTHGTVDGKETDGWSIFDDPMLASTVYQVPGNNSRIIVADAYNYLGDDDIEIEDGLEYEWIFNSDNPKQTDFHGNESGLETRKKISNKSVSKSKKLSLINCTIFTTGYYHCIIKNDKGTTETPKIYISCKGGLIIEREEIRNPETNEFLGYGAPTGKLIEDSTWAHPDTVGGVIHPGYKKTDGWMGYSLEENEWYRTAWDYDAEEWYTRDDYKGLNPWRTPKYGEEPTSNDDTPLIVANPTNTSVVSNTPQVPPQLRRAQVGISQVQTVATNTVARNNTSGRTSRIIDPSR